MALHINRRALLCIVILGGIIRLAVAVPVLLDPAMAIQHDNFFLLARQIITEGTYTHTLFGPGYPAFLVPFSLLLPKLATVAVVMVQVVLSTATIYLTALLAEAIFQEDNALPLVAAVLVAIHPPSIIHTTLIITEPLYTFIIMIGFNVLMRGPQRVRHAAALGLLVGIGALTRGNGLIVGALMTCYMLFSRYRPAITVLFLFAFMLPVLMWSYHNLTTHGHFSPTSSGDYNIAALVVGPAKSLHEGLPMAGNLYIWIKDMDEVPQGDFERAALVREMAYAWVTEHPMAFVKAFVLGQARVFVGPGAVHWKQITGISTQAIYALTFMNLLAVALAAIGVVVLRGRLPFIALGFLLLIVACHVLPTGAAGYSRFLVPAYPVLAVLAAGGVLYVKTRAGAIMAGRPKTSRP